LKQNNNQKTKKKWKGGEREKPDDRKSIIPSPANVPMFYYDTFDDEENNTRAFKKRERERENKLLFEINYFLPLPP
jgi:hypothetical protein